MADHARSRRRGLRGVNAAPPGAAYLGRATPNSRRSTVYYIVTSAKTNAEAKSLLIELGMPFSDKGRQKKAQQEQTA